MFDRYTPHARQSVFFARYEASRFGVRSIETYYLLLGLFRADPILTARLLADEKAAGEIRAEFEDLAIEGADVPTSVDLPLSRGLKRALHYAAREAGKGSKIAAGHLFLGS